MYASIKDKDVTKFIWKNIVCRFWNPSSNHSRQQPVVWQHCLPNFLFITQNPKFVLHATISPKQWAGKGNEQDLTDRFKEKIGASQRKVGGGAARHLVGLPDHARTTNRKHSFRSRIRNRRIHPHGNRFAHDPDCGTRSKRRKLRTKKEPRLGGWSERKRIHLDGSLPTKGGCSLQP